MNPIHERILDYLEIELDPTELDEIIEQARKPCHDFRLWMRLEFGVSQKESETLWRELRDEAMKIEADEVSDSELEQRFNRSLD